MHSINNQQPEKHALFGLLFVRKISKSSLSILLFGAKCVILQIWVFCDLH